MTTEPPQAAQMSGLALLTEWANGQDHWLRKLVGEVIETRDKLSDERIAGLYDCLCREKEIVSGDPCVVEMLSAEGFDIPTQATVQLNSLQHIENVNAIAENQEIKFHERMTICYGENASGKTGYVRIIKNAAWRTTMASPVDPVLSNIYRNRGKEIPQAKFKFTVGGQESAIEWIGEQGVAPLTQIDIFDSEMAMFHIKKDMSYSYTPAAIRLFPLVNDEIERVQEKLEIEKSNIQRTLNTHANQFPQGSPISLKFGEILPLTNINKATALNLLKDDFINLSQVSNEEKAELPSLREKVAALSSGEVPAQIKQAKKEKDILESSLNIASLINKFNREAYTAALLKLRTAREAHEDATHEALIDEDIPEVLGDVWKKFIRAAEDYIKEIDIEPYPTSGKNCIYCRQPLGDATVNLLDKYRNYCNDALQQKVDQAQQEIRFLSKTICEYKIEKPELAREGLPLPITFHDLVIEKAQIDIKELVSELEDPSSPPANLVAACDIVNYALKLKQALQQDENCLPLPLNFQASLEIIIRKTKAIEKTIADLSTEGEERREALVVAQRKQQDIEARIKLAELMPTIDIYFKIVSYLNNFPSIKNNLTITEKKASDALINKNFEKRFKEECEALNAPNIKLEFPGRGSATQKRKTMRGDHNLDKVLSEGEQKIIALADFLADASLKPNSSPVVFDDPVTSLDYKRLRRVVNRFFDLSQDRQVIVFTHDIWFTRELLERFEVDTTKREFNEIKSEGPRCGIVYNKKIFEADNFNKFEKKIRETLEWASEEQGERRLDLVKSGYSQLRSACEVIAERDFLKDVVSRYRPNIRMTALGKINAVQLPKVIPRVMDIFHKCSRFTDAHSQPLPTLAERPSIRELREDLATVKNALEEYNQK